MLLKNIKIINHDEIIKNSDIEIENGKIKRILTKDGEASLIAVPGFIDTHIHGFVGYDSMDGKKAIETISKELGKRGTTAFFPTLMTSSMENILRKIREATEAKSIGSEIVGLHLEGPFISLEKKGAHDEKYITKASDDNLEKLISNANGLLKKITVAPESISKEQIKILLDGGVMPSLGHSNIDALTASQYIEEGSLSATHLWNAMSGVQNRKPGLVEASLNSDKLFAELICDLVHVDEDAIKLAIKSKTPNRIIAVTDAIRPAGLKDGDFESGGLDITKKGKLITLKGTSTIAGSGATMMDNFETLVMLGYDIKDVVAMTSTNAAKLFDLTDMGNIKEGKKANINLLDKKGKLKEVYIKGEIQ